MIYLYDIEEFLKLPNSSVDQDCAYIEFVWGCDKHSMGQVEWITGAPRAYQRGDYWIAEGVYEFFRRFMLQNNYSSLDIAGARYAMYDSEGNLLDTANIGSGSFTIFYVERPLKIAGNLSADDFAANFFPLTDIIGWKAPEQRYEVFRTDYLFNHPVSVTYTYKDGSTSTSSSASLSFSLSDDDDIVSAQVVQGNRELTVIYLYDSMEIFSFRSIFNHIETVSIPGAITNSPSINIEFGAAGKYVSRRAILQDVEFTLKTGPLPKFMYRTIIAMCRSGAVRWGGKDIVVTEFKFPKSNEPNTPATLELKFKYADTALNNAVKID